MKYVKYSHFVLKEGLILLYFITTMNSHPGIKRCFFVSHSGVFEKIREKLSILSGLSNATGGTAL